MRKADLLTLLIAATAAQLGVRIYDVDVWRNCSATVLGDQEHGVRQSFTCTADCLLWVSFFVGAASASGQYHFDIMDGNTRLYHGDADAGDSVSYSYVMTTLQPYGSPRLIKGKQYVLKITNSNPNQMINFYYSDQDPYPYGMCSWSDTGNRAPLVCDLCARIEGIARVDSLAIGCLLGFDRQYGDAFSLHDSVRQMAVNAGIRTDRVSVNWCDVQPESTQWNWCGPDSAFAWSVDRAHMDSLGVITWCPAWATSGPCRDMALHCSPSSGSYAPRGLFEPVFLDSARSQVNPANPWAVCIDSVLRHYRNKVRRWSLWNAAAELVSFGYPDTAKDYDTIIAFGDPASLMRLYAQMCKVACQVRDRIDPGIKFHVFDGGDLAGDLPRFYDEGGGPCFDVLNEHYYTDIHNPTHGTYSPADFTGHFQALRNIMAAHGDRDKPIWLTEIGWNTHADSGYPRERQADYLVESYVTGFASTLDPSVLIDRYIWYDFRNDTVGESERIPPAESCFGIVYRDLAPKPAYYALKQLTDNTKGKMRNAASGPNPGCYTCEFENPLSHKRFWVVWKQGAAGGPMAVKLPGRTDAAGEVPIAYTGNSSTIPLSAGPDGYLSVQADTAPVYVFEDSASTLHRPDLVLDSVWTEPDDPAVGKSGRLWARVRNDGTANWTMPQGHWNAVTLRFYANGALVGTADNVPSIAQGEWTLVSSRNTWTPRHQGDQLVRAVVNESKAIVELDWDNNARYRLYQIH